MTQDVQFSAEANPFAAAEQVCATLGTLTDALFDDHVTRHPAASLSAPRAAEHPDAEALFGLPLAPNGPVHTALGGLGTVVTAGTARPGTGARSADRVTAALHARYGGGAVRGAIADRGTISAALFHLPVNGEFADAKLRPPFAPALAALAAGQQTRQPVELPTGAGTEVRLVVPPGFHPLTSPGGPAGVTARTVPAQPAAADGADPAALAAADELAGHLAEVADELFAAAGSEVRRDFAVVAGTLADALRDSGAVYAGVCALESEGRRSDAALVVSLARHPLPITGLATELATVRRHAEVWTVLLPAGPAAVLVEGRTVPVPGPLAADGQRRWVVTSAVQAFVPLPDGGTVLCVQLSTAQPEDWELYTEAFAELLKSVQFGWDGELAAGAPVVAPVPVSVEAAGEPAPDPVVEVPAERPVERHGTPVQIPPVDFNPFAPIAEEEVKPEKPEPVAQAVEAIEDAPPLKGTPVMIPPPDFNPFAPESLPTPVTAEPAAPTASTAPDPFGTTVAAAQRPDPFGTTIASDAPVVPPPPSAPPLIPAQAEPVAQAVEAVEDAPPLKGTPVMIPPPDFNPFAPESLPTPVAAAEPEGESEAEREPEHRPFG
ncbi:hypothetical protein [Kitasatospora sp. NPDC101183]|uniref:hypothetical protein n=1 Tax=Kitasatospora sp. NPDC101183 TaxID=3364100 RepID=UPI003804A2D9